MVANERLVQAWREIGWPAGVYSIVKFKLTEQSAGTYSSLITQASPKEQRHTWRSGGKHTTGSR